MSTKLYLVPQNEWSREGYRQQTLSPKPPMPSWNWRPTEVQPEESTVAPGHHEYPSHRVSPHAGPVQRDLTQGYFLQGPITTLPKSLMERTSWQGQSPQGSHLGPPLREHDTRREFYNWNESNPGGMPQGTITNESPVALDVIGSLPVSSKVN